MLANVFLIIEFNYVIIRINLCRCIEWNCIVIIIWKFCWILIVMVEFTMEMVIGNEELNLIILTQFYSIIACYVFYYFY
jgi:hypothetical protein